MSLERRVARKGGELTGQEAMRQALVRARAVRGRAEARRQQVLQEAQRPAPHGRGLREEVWRLQDEQLRHQRAYKHAALNARRVHLVHTEGEV